MIPAVVTKWKERTETKRETQREGRVIAVTIATWLCYEPLANS